MLICQDISYAESLMGMLDTGLDNGGMEMNALHAYYDEISGELLNVPMWLPYVVSVHIISPFYIVTIYCIVL